VGAEGISRARGLHIFGTAGYSALPQSKRAMPKSNLRRVISGELHEMTPANESSAGAPADNLTIPGKVVHDPRGTAVYDWNVATGEFAVMNTTDLLGILENPTLALEGEPTLLPEWSGDPYNRR